MSFSQHYRYVPLQTSTAIVVCQMSEEVFEVSTANMVPMSDLLAAQHVIENETMEMFFETHGVKSTGNLYNLVYMRRYFEPDRPDYAVASLKGSGGYQEENICAAATLLQSKCGSSDNVGLCGGCTTAKLLRSMLASKDEMDLQILNRKSELISTAFDLSDVRSEIEAAKKEKQDLRVETRSLQEERDKAKTETRLAGGRLEELQIKTSMTRCGLTQISFALDSVANKLFVDKETLTGVRVTSAIL